MTEMTDDELSRAVAERRGWVCVADCGVANYQHLHRGNECVDNFAFATSMDACLAPGGPVEYLGERGLSWDTWQLTDGRFTFRISPGSYFADADTLPRALCLAFIAATEGE